MLAEQHDIDRLPYSIKVLLENLLRHEDGPHVSADDIVAVADWGSNPEGHGQGAGDVGPRDRLHARARPDAGLHRRPGRGRPGRDPRCAGTPRRRRHPRQPPRPRRACHRPLGDRRAVGLRRVVRRQRVDRVLAQPGAVPTPPLGPGRVPGLPSGTARHGHLPPGQPRVPLSPRVRDRRRARLLRHTRGHRLAHRDGQRARRARVGRRRDRGGGGNVGTTAVDAPAPGGRPADLRSDSTWHHCDRRGPHRHRAAARSRRRRARSSSATAPVWRRSPSRPVPPSAT